MATPRLPGAKSGVERQVDPDGDLYPLLYTKAGFNFAKYSNPESDKLLDAGRTNLEQPPAWPGLPGCAEDPVAGSTNAGVLQQPQISVFHAQRDPELPPNVRRLPGRPWISRRSGARRARAYAPSPPPPPPPRERGLFRFLTNARGARPQCSTTWANAAVSSSGYGTLITIDALGRRLFAGHRRTGVDGQLRDLVVAQAWHPAARLKRQLPAGVRKLAAGSGRRGVQLAESRLADEDAARSVTVQVHLDAIRRRAPGLSRVAIVCRTVYRERAGAHGRQRRRPPDINDGSPRELAGC